MQKTKSKRGSERDLYYVAVKVFLERKGKLFIFKDRYGAWDLPGGRIQKHEFHALLWTRSSGEKWPRSWEVRSGMGLESQFY